MEQFVRFINSTDPEIGATIIDPEAVFHVPFSKEPLHGLQGYLQVLAMMRSSFSDIRWTLEETVIEGDTVAARFTLTGTHDGDFFGIPATHRTISAPAMNHYTFTNGQITSERGLPDIFGIMSQLRGTA